MQQRKGRGEIRGGGRGEEKGEGWGKEEDKELVAHHHFSDADD